MSERGIRTADGAELERLREIERLAGAAFRDLDMASVADDEPPSVETLTGYVADGRAWVATAPDGVAIGYLLLDVIDGCGHIEQVSTDPSYRGRGVGRTLIDHAGTWSARHGLAGLTLTTFADVPWNAPYYERLGFRRLTDSELTPGLLEVRRHEQTLGLDRWPRVAMRREVDRSAG
jgi:GNAT superfamily N-acetyltransferase